MASTMLSLYAKALLSRKKTTSSESVSLPELTLNKVFVANPEHQSRYHSLVDWPLVKTGLIHPNYIQTMSLPMQLEMILNKHFPFKAMGLVHLANQIQCTSLPKQQDTLNISTSFGEVYAHKKGWVFEVITKANSTDNIDSANDDVTATSYYLARVKPVKKENSAALANAEQQSPLPVWIEQKIVQAQKLIRNDSTGEPLYFAKDIGRRYASVSGDYNPIHLHALTAKALGFGQAIAHGMYSKAQALSLLASKTDFYNSEFVCRFVFMQPIFLPQNTTLSLGTNAENSTNEDLLCLHSTSSKGEARIHLAGIVQR